MSQQEHRKHIRKLVRQLKTKELIIALDQASYALYLALAIGLLERFERVAKIEKGY